MHGCGPSSSPSTTVSTRGRRTCGRWRRESRNTCTPDVAVSSCEIWWETDIRGVSALGAGADTPDRRWRAATGGSRSTSPSLMPQAELKVFPGAGEWPRRGDGGRATRASTLRGDPALRRRRAAPTRAGHDPLDGAVHRHRRLDRAQAAARRPGWKDLSSAITRPVREALARLARRRERRRRRRLLATFDGPARAIHCAIEISIVSATCYRDPRRRPHRRVRVDRRQVRRHRRHSPAPGSQHSPVPPRYSYPRPSKTSLPAAASPSSRQANTNSKACLTAGGFCGRELDRLCETERHGGVRCRPTGRRPHASMLNGG